ISLYAEKHNLDQYNFYFQDEWKVRPNLTLNYGARWEYNPPANTSPNENVFVASTPIVGNPFTGNTVTFVKAKHWYEGSFAGAIGPRFGLAWSPNFKSGPMRVLFGDNSKSVIRLGYGIAFDTISSFQVTAAAGRVPGLVQSCTKTFPFTTITNGCVNSPDINKTLAGGFPTQLPAPSVKPSTFFTPPLQTRSNAPPITVFDPHMNLPTVHEWNFSIQRELPRGFVVQASYIGRRGERLFMAYDANQIRVEPIVPSFFMLQANNSAPNCLPSGATRDTTTPGKPPCVPVFPASQIPLLAAGVTGINAAFVNSTNTQGELTTNNVGMLARRIEDTTLAFRLRPNQQFSVITYLSNEGDSNYHAAQFTLRRRFSSGLGLNLAYTYGRSIDNQSVDPVGASSGGGLSTTNSRTPTDIRNFRDERGRSDFDRTHVFTAASVWELPFGKGQRFFKSSSGIVNQAVGGWTLNAIYTFMTGEPFAVRSGIFTANGSHESRAGVQQPVKAQLQEPPGLPLPGPVLFKPLTNVTTCGVDLTQAFCIPLPGQNGAGRNIFTAPNYWNLDLGLIKTFPINEQWKLQFRMEMFNALNHGNFDNPRDASTGSPSIRSSVFASACCATVAPPSTQTVVQTGESARVIQFAFKFLF